MLKARTDNDEYSLLCEGCGYVIEGLPVSGNCPECGVGIAESLPERRTGSFWQHAQTGSAWVETFGAVLTAPRSTMRRLAIVPSSSQRLAWGNAYLAAVCAVAPVLFVSLLPLWRVGAARAFGGLLAAALVYVAVAFAVRGLTRIEELGIRAYGRARKHRISRDVALVICSHAAYGWVVGGAMLGAGVVLGAIGETLELAGLILAALSPAVGLLWFETLVYIGVRQCLYANPPGAGRPAAAREPISAAGGTFVPPHTQ